MASSGKVYKKCVIEKRCPNEKCDHPWYCLFWRNGVRYRMSIPQAFGVNPKKRSEAESVWLPKFVNEINEAAREGREPFPTATVNTNVWTVAEFIDQHYVPRYYQAETIAEIESPDGRSKVKLLRRDLGELRLVQLESEVVVDDYKKKLEASGLGVPGRNRRLSKLRQMLNWAKDWKFISRVPFSRNLVSLDTDQEVNRERRLEPGEEAKLLKAADAEMKLRIKKPSESYDDGRRSYGDTQELDGTARTAVPTDISKKRLRPAVRLKCSAGENRPRTPPNG